MRLVDTTKIDPYRAMIDEEIARLSIAGCVSRPAAYARLLETFGYSLRLRLLAGAPVFGCAIPVALLDSQSILRQALARPNHPREVKRDIANVLAAEIDAAWLRSGCAGMTPEDVATAITLLILDRNADVFVAVSETFTAYGDEWQKLATSDSDHEYIYSDPYQMMLFETAEEFEQRQNDAFRALALATCEQMAYSVILG